MKRLGILVVGLLLAACTAGNPAAQRTSPPVSASSTPSLSPSATGSVSTQRTPVAGDFVVDLTWISSHSGWALLSSPCSRGRCPEVARTDDGGRTWVSLPASPALLADGVEKIRFATARIGYLFGPSLFVTHDGGVHWTKEASQPVEDLEPSAGTVVRIVFDHSGCPGPCNRTIQEAAAGSTAWRTLRSIPMGFEESRADRAEVIRQGTQTIYVPIYGNLAAGAGSQHTVIFRSLDAGRTWTRLDDPCGESGTAVFDGISFAAPSSRSLTALCVPRQGPGGGGFVITSRDAGSSWSSRHPTPGWAGIIAAASPTRLVIGTPAVTGNGPFTYRLAVSTDGGVHWSSVVTDPEQVDSVAPGGGFLGFETTTVGRWVGDPRAMWTTEDGGIHWTRRNIG